MTATIDFGMDELFGDMNGPLAYWGPAQAPALTAPGIIRSTPRHDADCIALDRLAETIGGRTWVGTSTLMDAAFIQAAVALRPASLAAA
jgi:hypothetical protein